MTPWTITFNERSWTNDDLLACDVATVQSLTQGSWDDIDPWRGPMQLMAMVAALESRVSGRDPLEVLDALRPLPLADLLGLIADRPGPVPVAA